MFKKILAASILCAAVLMSGCATQKVTELESGDIQVGSSSPCDETQDGFSCVFAPEMGLFGYTREIVFSPMTAALPDDAKCMLWGKIPTRSGATAEMCTLGTRIVDNFEQPAEYLRLCLNGSCTLRNPTVDHVFFNKWQTVRDASAILLFTLWQTGVIGGSSSGSGGASGGSAGGALPSPPPGGGIF